MMSKEPESKQRHVYLEVNVSPLIQMFMAALQLSLIYVENFHKLFKYIQQISQILNEMSSFVSAGPRLGHAVTSGRNTNLFRNYSSQGYQVERFS